MSESTKPVFVVVGGSSGIGAATASRLASQGHTVVLSARNQERLAASASALGADFQMMDARDSGAIEAGLAQIHQRHGRIDGIVNCAGSILLKPAHLTTDQEFAEVVSANLTTAFNVLRSAVRLMMKQQGGGSIVLCSSVAAQRGLMNHEAVAAAKAGVEGLALAAAATYARQSVRVNCVAPALTRTPLTKGLTQNEALARASAAMHPLGRIGEPEDVASAVCWLLSPEQSWVTGQVIGIDGGLGRVQSRG